MNHLTPEQINQLRKSLEDKLRGLRGFNTSAIEENPANNPDRVDDNESGDDAAEEYGMLASEAFTQESSGMIKEITDALQKIEDGTYGVDEQTGEPIPYQRLAIMPEARTASAKNER